MRVVLSMIFGMLVNFWIGIGRDFFVEKKNDRKKSSIEKKNRRKEIGTFSIKNVFFDENLSIFSDQKVRFCSRVFL